MPELVAIAYDDETVADCAIEELRRCGEELGLDPDASAVLVCERDGTCRLTTSRHADAQARWAEFWGAFLEALLSQEDDPAAIDGRFRGRLLPMLRPGASVLLLSMPGGGEERVLRALSHFGGRSLVQGPGLDR
ncbi:MAG: hypothetical protein JST08_03070 [Actinobacteria bacterium]|nr:hypothetical protein [Actinomycetota bacterium]